MADVAEILNAAADLLEKPGAWTQGALGRLEDGSAIYHTKDLRHASCFCMAGALWVANGYDYPKAAFDALPDGPRQGTGSWNDAPCRTQAEVVAALREAALRSTHPTGADQ